MITYQIYLINGRYLPVCTPVTFGLALTKKIIVIGHEDKPVLSAWDFNKLSMMTDSGMESITVETKSDAINIIKGYIKTLKKVNKNYPRLVEEFKQSEFE